MLRLCLLSCILTLSVIYSRSSLSKQNGHQEESQDDMQSEHVSAYMWEVYLRGVNASVSEFDVVKGLYPKMSDLSFESLLCRNHGKQLEFFIPESQQGERLVQAEMRITPEGEKFLETSFQIYFKADKWLFLGQKKVSDVNVTHISFPVTPVALLAPGVATFLVLSPRREGDIRPALLLSYRSDRPDRSQGDPARRKRSPRPEDFEEETNRVWEEEMFPRSASAEAKSVKSGCRRKPLYIKFSEIAFDSWVVAPSGYEAFQCVGKCTFPLSEHLSPTKHAILQTLVHNAYPWKASRACCVPTRLEPISLLYLDDGGVLTYRFRYRDMVVAECGCR